MFLIKKRPLEKKKKKHCVRKVRQTQQDRDRFEYVLYFRFTLSLDDDYSWLLYLVGISTGSVIIFRLLPFVFFSSQFV